MIFINISITFYISLSILFSISGRMLEAICFFIVAQIFVGVAVIYQKIDGIKKGN